MPLGREVGLGPGEIVRWGPSSHTESGTAAAPSFWLMSIVAKRLHISATSVILVLFRLQGCGYTSDSPTHINLNLTLILTLTLTLLTLRPHCVKTRVKT